MASSPKMDYPVVKNYVAQFPWAADKSYLILAYDVDRKFRFVDLKAGNILALKFDSVEDAESWLHKFSNVHLENSMETTYIP